MASATVRRKPCGPSPQPCRSTAPLANVRPVSPETARDVLAAFTSVAKYEAVRRGWKDGGK
jgi:hypothetical protein